MAGTPNSLVLALLAEFAGDLRGARSINQLARSSGKAYANTHATAQILLRDDVLTKAVVGHSHQCRLNLTNDKTLLYLCLLETQKRDELLRKDPTTRVLLSLVDANSARLGILLVWQRQADTLIVTANEQVDAQHLLPTTCTILPLAAFLQDRRLRTTISKESTLLFGHALYASLLREVAR